jgi:hypothetical protein
MRLYQEPGRHITMRIKIAICVGIIFFLLFHEVSPLLKTFWAQWILLQLFLAVAFASLIDFLFTRRVEEP